MRDAEGQQLAMRELPPLRGWRRTHDDADGVDGSGAHCQPQQRYGEHHAHVADGEREAAGQCDGHQRPVGLPQLGGNVGDSILGTPDLQQRRRRHV